MSYLYFGSTGSYTTLVDNTENSLDAISPSYFDLNADGSLKLTSALTTSFIKDMHARGIQVTPFLSNHWDRQTGINALNNREALSSKIAKAVTDYGLDGVDVDIENVTPAEKSIYVDFVRLLRQKLPGKSISVAVAPNPWDLTTGWNASYDYAGLARYADYLMLMAYDESYEGGPEGPVADGDFVEQSIEEALTKVSPDKLVLGIPFYGRLWKQGASYGGYGVSNNTVEDLISKYRGVVTYDAAKESAKAVITIKSGDVKPVVLGQQLTAGTYDIWFENEQSIKYKLQLVEKYNLKGTGSWSLGQEAQSMWDYYDLWLNGVYFKDIQGYWAQQSIMDVAEKGWMVGVSDLIFDPAAPMTRAQAAVLLVRAMGLEGNATGVAYGTYFTDTVGHWAQKDIDIAAEYGIVDGMGNGRFMPDRTVTREEMAAMLDRVLEGDPDSVSGSAGGGTIDDVIGTPASAESPFEDVSSVTSPWSYDSIMRMASQGILTGFPDGLFHPTDTMTRAQMAVLIDRTAPLITDGLTLASLN